MNLSELKPCFVYIRVSTTKQAKEGLSLENQKMKCIEYANRNGYRIEKIYEERGVSGKTMHRKVFMDMVSMLRSGDTIIVNAFARLGRNVKQMIESYDAIKKKGCHIVSLSELHIDDTKPHGKFVLNMMFNMAEYELNETTARSAAIIHNKRVCGEVIGPVGYGFDVNEWDGRRYIYPCVEEQRVISYIIECRTKRDPPERWVDIARYLEENEWKPKKTNHWNVSSIKTLFANHTKYFRDPLIYGISCNGLRDYEKYKVPLHVPREDIYKNISEETGEFDYLKYFGYMYGDRGVHFPTVEKMKKDLDDGRIVTSEKIKNAIVAANEYGIDENGEAMDEEKQRISQLYSKVKNVDLSKQDKGMVKKFFKLFGSEDNIDEKAKLFFE